MNKFLTLFAGLAAALLAGAPTAHAASYTARWLATVTNSTFSNGTYCLVVKDDGSYGWPHSGSATLPDQGLTFGTFQVINSLFVATVEAPGGSGQNAGIVFMGRAQAGNIGNGVYEEVYGGEDFDSGKAGFVKNGC